MRTFFLFILCLLGFVGFFPCTVQAVTVTAGYQASVLSLDYPRELAPGTIGQIKVQFQNIGTSTWAKDGKNFVSLYRWDPRTKAELASAFGRPSWETSKRPSRISLARVAPGAKVDVVFPIAAPTKPGIYREEFVLAAENLAWVAYSPFVVEIRVGAGAIVASANPSSMTSTPLPAATDWRAEVISQGGLAWQLDPNQAVEVRFLLKNTGTKTWTREGANYVSLYSIDKQNKERNSPFAPVSGWLTTSHVVKMQEAQIAPGETATFLFSIRAPRVAGRYQESFLVAAEGVAWVQGSAITIPIAVTQTGDFIATAPPMDVQVPMTTSPVPSGKYAGVLLLQSNKTIKVVGGTRADMTLGFKNVGTETWGSRSVQLVGVRTMQGDEAVSLRDQSWNGSTEAVSLLGTTKPGEIAFASFSLRAPMRRGDYRATFQLYGDSQPVEGGAVEIPITVTNDAAQAIPLPAASAPSAPSYSSSPSPSVVAPTAPPVDSIPITGDVASLPAEPSIRVGLFRTTDDQMQIRAMQVPVSVQQNGTEVCQLSTGQVATVRYDRVNRVYVLQGGSCASQSAQWYVFRTTDGIAPMQIADFSRPVSWLPGANDNTFRAQLELRYTPATDGVWIINELPFEYYLHGIAETSDSSPPEFQRTLLIAARTYAYYHIQHATKHANEFYIVDATYDQVYRGYGAEARSPTITAAVDATRGQIVTYNGKLAITPYFSRSDGRTRSWGEVWYGGSQYPWLVSVPVPEDQGRTLWGHGVGLSASGALDMARAGKGYVEILKHFYTGIELRRAYK